LNVNDTLIAVVELSQKTWLIAGIIIPGIERQPLKKLEPDENAVLNLLERWLRARGIEAHVIHAHARRGVPRPTGSTPSSSNEPFLAGCAASGSIAK
jgi:hypothetical protein